LVSLNRSVDTVIETLRKLAEYLELQERESFMVSQSYFRENSAYANLSILEAIHGAASGEGSDPRHRCAKLDCHR
jgi:hypothetical protein